MEPLISFVAATVSGGIVYLAMRFMLPRIYGTTLPDGTYEVTMLRAQEFIAEYVGKPVVIRG